jgi:hypothetical protein
MTAKILNEQTYDVAQLGGTAIAVFANLTEYDYEVDVTFNTLESTPVTQDLWMINGGVSANAINSGNYPYPSLRSSKIGSVTIPNDSTPSTVNRIIVPKNTGIYTYVGNFSFSVFVVGKTV